MLEDAKNMAYEKYAYDTRITLEVVAGLNFFVEKIKIKIP